MAVARSSSSRAWGSPIESMLHAAVVDFARHNSKSEFTLHDFSTSTQPAIALVDGKSVSIGGPTSYYEYGAGRDYSVELYGGVRVDSYKLDMALVYESVVLAIECDGHEWHERTKEQASSDRARDRALLRLGVSCVRFTGSDIHARADECAAEIFETMKALVDRHNAVESDSIKSFFNGRDSGRQDAYLIPGPIWDAMTIARSLGGRLVNNSGCPDWDGPPISSEDAQRISVALDNSAFVLDWLPSQTKGKL